MKLFILLPLLLISCTQQQPESPPAHEPAAMLYTGSSLPDVEIHIIEAGGHKFAVAVAEHSMTMVEIHEP